MVVTEDGTVYCNVPWDEAGREVGIYKDGDVIGIAQHTHGWGYDGGNAIALNQKYVFIAQRVGNEGGNLKGTNTWPAKGLSWYGVSRRLRADVTRGAPFSGGKGGQGDTLKGCFLVVIEAPEKAEGGIAGLCADEHRLYVSCAGVNEIRIYDTETMEPVAHWPAEHPGSVVVDPIGTIWLLHPRSGSAPAWISRHTAEGNARRIEFAADAQPTALCLAPKDRLLVADNGPSQQVLIFENVAESPRLAGTFGAKGGIFSGVPGGFGPLKFNHPSAVGCDAQGNFYIAQDGQSGGGGTVLESYAPEGKLNWRLFGLEFVDMADLDPASEADLFTKEEHFRLDYTRPPGQQWTYQGYTLDPFRYPEDPRLHLWSAGAWVRRIQGKRFLFVNDMYSEALQVYRFDSAKEGELAVPSVFFAKSHIKKQDQGWPPGQPDKGEWIWRDGNGNGAFDGAEFLSNGGKDAPPLWGWWVDSAGNVWQATQTAGIRKFACQGLDAQGNPIYDFASLAATPMPAPFTRLERIYYFPATDTMYLAGYTADRPHHDGLWKVMGRVICRYDHWSKGQSSPRWQISPDYTVDGSWKGKPASMSVAVDYVFVVYVVGGRIEVYNAQTGASVGHLKPGPEVGGDLPGEAVGWVDIPEGIQAIRRPDGECLVLVEEDWKSKVLMYQWKPEAPPGKSRQPRSRKSSAVGRSPFPGAD
jgi:hypothetical protein